LRSKFKVGLVGGIAALLVAIGAFGFGGVTTSQANIVQDSYDCDGEQGSSDDYCVFAVAEHGIDPSVGNGAQAVDFPTCDDGAGWDSASSPFGIVKPDEALLVDTSNFPPQSGSYPLSSSLPMIRLQTGDSVLICVNAEGVDNATTGGILAAGGDLSFDSNDNGTWDRPSCGFLTVGGPDNPGADDGDSRLSEWPDDKCGGPIGVGTDFMIIPADQPGPGYNDLTSVIVRFNCGTFVGTTRVTIQQDQNSFQFNITCRDDPDDITLSCSPCTVEIVPARSNTAHSLIQAIAIDDDDDNTFAITGADVDFKTDRCAIETSAFLDDDLDEDDVYWYLHNYLDARLAYRALSVAIPATYYEWDLLANEYGVDETSSNYGGSGATSDTGLTFDVDSNVDGTVAAAWLHCDVHSGVTTATPGVATVSACWEVNDGADLCKFIQVTVIGPPASITVAASPTSLRCGEKSTVTATVKDAIGQNVSDHTRVEFVTNLGGTLAGTGGVAGFAGPVVPISSNVGDTFGGVATVFLITSEVTSGPYEVVATSGGTSSTDGFGYTYGNIYGYSEVYHGGTPTYLGGVFSTPPVSAQVTVTCNIPVPATAAPAPTVTAPRTGTGVTPPNTGDAGLADTSGASWTLFAIGGIVALSLAGFATVKAARR
jgi:hypothetical protein